MTGIGMNLTEYTSAEISILIHAVSVQQIDASISSIFNQKAAKRRLEILDQWNCKLHEAREIVRREENIQSN